MKYRLLILILLVVLLLPVLSSAMTIKNTTSAVIAGSICFKDRDIPIFQFFLEPYEKLKWHKNIKGDEFVLHALPDKMSKTSFTPVSVTLKNLDCYVEIKKDHKTGLKFEIDQ